MIHYLKTVQPYFDDSKSGRKKFEVRKNDRKFKLYDEVILEEWDLEKQEYTGKRLDAKIIFYILSDKNYCKDGYVILGLE